MTLKRAAGFFLGMFACVAAAQEPSPIYIFSTLAGSAGVAGSADGTGAAARFKAPAGLGVDAEGNVYVADRGNATVRKITPAGVVTTLAGKAGETGVVDGEGAEARFGVVGLAGLAVDGAGNLFVTDTDVVPTLTPPIGVILATLTPPIGVILAPGGIAPPSESANKSHGYLRKISRTGSVTTVAGGGDYIVKYDGKRVPATSYSGAYDGTGSEASLSAATGITIDAAGMVFVLDEDWRVIRKITQGGVVSSLIANPAGNFPLFQSDIQMDGGATVARLGIVNQIAINPAGGFLVSTPDVGRSDLSANLRPWEWVIGSNVKRVTAGGEVSTIAGNGNGPYGAPVDGIGRDAQFRAINGLAMDRTGTLFLVDDTTVRLMTPALNVTTIGGVAAKYGTEDGVGSGARFSVMKGIAVDATGNIFVADTGNCTIRKGTRATKPVIQTQPVAKTVVPGEAVTLTMAATGFPEPTYQWSKNGAAVAGATGATLTLSAVQVADEGSYTVTATNVAGTFTSSAAVLTVGTLPVISAPPVAQAATGGQRVTLTVAVAGTPAPTLQWRKDGVAIAGATGTTLTLPSAAAGDAGSYTVVATNAAGTVTSSAAVVTVNTSRIVNLAIRSNLAAGSSLIVGFVVAGNGKPLLVRAVGPGLGQFGLGGVLADPRMSLFAVSALIANNDNWGGAANAAQVTAAAGQVGAFGLPAGSLDAALLISLDGGGYSAQVTGASGAAGIVLVELYDAASATAARLLNVSARAVVGTGESALFAGFSVTGNAKRTVLVRAIGPTLAAFGATGVLADPRLELAAAGAGTPMATNDDWGGGANLIAAFGTVGAFPLAANAKDAALLVTLDPGSYSVQVTGVGGTTGEALVEIYEVP